MSDAREEKERKLQELRDGIAEVDRALLELVHRRMDLAAEVGRMKAENNKAIFVPEVHDRVLTRARRNAEACGVSEGVMESIYDAVMRGSIERQHKVAAELRADTGKRLLIIGGAGNMGVWYQGFARRLGHQVGIVDPAMATLPKTEGRYGSLDDISDLDSYDAILLCVPLGATTDVLREVIARRPQGLVIEITSIKDHLRDVLQEADDAGVRITCLHPMFGPGKSLYEQLTFVLACRDDPSTEKEHLQAWLQYPNVHLVTVPFLHHDRLMGWLLGLAHFSGMLFGAAVTRCGLGPEELAACASTTWDKQASTAFSVLQEDADLYYDIQQLNPHRDEVYNAARAALDELVGAVQNEDRDSFRAILENARNYMHRKS